MNPCGLKPWSTNRLNFAPWFGGAVLSALLLAYIPAVSAEEPYERFLQKLRDEQLFDLALVYLGDLQDKPTVGEQLKADFELERGLLLYQAAALLPASRPERPQKLDAAEQALQNFLKARPQHPRRGEARMKLGELLLTRAEEARSGGGAGSSGAVPQEDNTVAIKFYTEAHQLFESTIQELAGILEGMKGARIDPADTSAVAYRQKLQQDIRQSQLLSAKAMEDRGRSHAASSPQRTQDLESALKMFSDLYSKELGLVAVRNYALFYRSGIHATLGRVDDAIDGYQRIADAEGVDFLRPLQSQAITQLIQLLANQKKFPVAVSLAEKWLADVRPDERTTAETMALKLALAELKVAWSEELKRQNPEDRVTGRLIRDARNELRGILRTPGPHLEAARSLVAKLGVEETQAASEDLPPVKTFEEAVTAAQERIERSETAAITVEAIAQELADKSTSTERQQELSEQLPTTQAAIDVDQQQAIELLRSALRLFQASDSREQLYDARFRLAFLLLKQQRPWESMAVAEFLSRTAAGTDQGLRAAAITLGSFSDLLRTAKPQAKTDLTGQLRPFAEYLVATWPQSSEASAAASALVQLALINRDFEQAKQFLNLVPSGGAATAKLRRDAGLTFYAKYLEEKKTSSEETATTVQLRKQAIELLQAGVAELTPDTLDATAIDAVNVAARLLQADGQVAAAAALMFDSASSPLSMLEKDAHGLPPRTVMTTLRTAIQLKMALVNADQLPAGQAAEQVREYIQRLQAAASEGESSQLLAETFVGLARDLKEQVADTQDEAKRRQMSESLLAVAVEAAKANSFNTEYWAADTIVSIAQELESSPSSRQQALAAYQAAAQILDAILSKQQSQPGWINPPELVTQVRLKFAQTARGVGDYKNAIEQLATILEQNPGLLDVQMEAAKTYQAWGTAVNSGFHRVAIVGGRPDVKTRVPLIWGWGGIQKRTANQPKFEEQFFEARYQLAYSRLQYARGLPDANTRSAELGRALQDIESTAKLYPELGGPGMKKRFQSLLKIVKQAQGS